MTKVVYNACYGGFSLSKAAILRGRELSGDAKWGGPYLLGDKYSNGETVDTEYGGGGRDIERTDFILIQVVTELGANADGFCAHLAIAEVPEGTKYRIDEYDGKETVMTIDDYEWKTA